MNMSKVLMITLLFAAFSLTGCEKGPAEKAGESIDQAADKVKDAMTPDGPMEKAGEKVDHAVDTMKDSVKDNK